MPYDVTRCIICIYPMQFNIPAKNIVTNSTIKQLIIINCLIGMQLRKYWTKFRVIRTFRIKLRVLPGLKTFVFDPFW